MTQQPFSRPGAIDLSGLQAPPAGAAAGRRAPRRRRPAAGIAGTGSAYALDVTEENFQQLLEASMTAPVALVFYSPSQAPESGTMAADVATGRQRVRRPLPRRPHRHRRLAGHRPGDADPAGADALRAARRAAGRAADPGPAQLDELRALFNQLGQQLTAQGITGRHQPRTAAPPGRGARRRGAARRPALRRRPGRARRGRHRPAVAEYQKLVDGNPADAEAAAGLAMAKVLQRTQGVDLQAARDAAAANPDDVDAQTLVADLDMLGGHVEDAFTRLVDVVRRTAGDDRNRAREHLLASSPPSATTTRGCSRARRRWRRRCSEAARTEPRGPVSRRSLEGGPAASSRATGTRNGEQET